MNAESRAEAGRSGARRSLATIRAQAAAGRAAAVAWRESRRCRDCGALAYVPCDHRPDGMAR